MKKRLTISADADVISIAQRCANSRGISLSSLIEQSIREIAKAEENTPSFTSRWRGEFRAAERNSQCYDALANKYLR